MKIEKYYRSDLDLRGVDGFDLPEDLTVCGCMDLEGILSINTLPKVLKVGHYFDIRGTNIKVLPEHLHIGGNFFLKNTQVIKLPDHLYVGKDLILSDTNIINLPMAMTVIGCLDLRRSKITEIPLDMKVNGPILTGAGLSEKVQTYRLNRMTMELPTGSAWF